MNYLSWDEKTISDFSESNIESMYQNGYVFTRIGRGNMNHTRSVRIDLSKFVLTSENRRVLKKTEAILLSPVTLPYDDYDFKVGKLAKDFYEIKFGPGIMSAQKVKEMLTDSSASNFNLLLTYSNQTGPKIPSTSGDVISTNTYPIGYAICYSSPSILHYSYPFYDLKESPGDMGMGMMIRAIEFAKNSGKKYIYLGSLQRPGDIYKLQFSGLEWFDGKVWSTDTESVKDILKA
jgi:arginyl-tRNA--protein-N-Asp/Glu arginylyltransferase